MEHDSFSPEFQPALLMTLDGHKNVDNVETKATPQPCPVDETRKSSKYEKGWLDPHMNFSHCS